MGKRMTKEERRIQLLAMADQIVQESGTEALTLISLADYAGVSKPITYEHFGSREALLSALYQSYDQRVIEAIEQAVAEQPLSLEATIDSVVKSYLACVVHCGSQYEEIIAALQAYPGYRNLKADIRYYFSKAYWQILQPHLTGSFQENKGVLYAIHGTIDAISDAVMMEGLSYEAAESLLRKLILTVVRSL